MSTTNGDGRTERLLEVKDLTVGFPTRDGIVRGVDGLTLNVGSHERLGVVGESGSGKSVMGLAILGMVLPPAGSWGARCAGGARMCSTPRWPTGSGAGRSP